MRNEELGMKKDRRKIVERRLRNKKSLIKAKINRR